jgi:hypothetical protein
MPTKEAKLDTLPTLVLSDILEYLPAADLFALRKSCKRFKKLVENEDLWKTRCLIDFPWFFWTGSCESTISVYIGGPRPPSRNSTQTDTLPTLETLKDPQFGPAFDGDMGYRCPDDCRQIRKNPYHPLPDSFLKAYVLIYYGAYTGYLQVLCSLTNREMSAFYALATYNRHDGTFALCYEESVIARYRRGNQITLKKATQLDPGVHDEWIDEVLPVASRVRFRRIPSLLLDADPRELHARDLFNMPVTKDGRPLLRPMDEVEVQWRTEPIHGYPWWRGYVLSSYLPPGYIDETESEITLPNEPINEILSEGILIIFPHYPEDSPWRAVEASIFGREAVGEVGIVGGVRKVECASHSMQWKLLFQESVESILRNQT